MAPPAAAGPPGAGLGRAVPGALGAWQQQAALAGAAALAAARGHAPARIEAKPTFANILLWKTVYETGAERSDGAGVRFHVDGVRPGLGPLLGGRVYPGTSILRLDLARDFPWLDPGSQQARDVERFRRLSGGFLAADPELQGGGHPGRIVDVRYSFLPTSVRGLWSIELAPDAGPDAPVRYRTHREGARERLGALWGMIVGDGDPPATRPLTLAWVGAKVEQGRRDMGDPATRLSERQVWDALGLED